MKRLVLHSFQIKVVKVQISKLTIQIDEFLSLRTYRFWE
jgi:hypothetical protein